MSDKFNGKDAAETSGDPKALRYFEGKADQKIHDRYDFMATGKDQKGPVAMDYVGKNAEVKQEFHGGAAMLLVGLEGKEFGKAADKFAEIAGDNLSVTVRFEDLSDNFSSRFKKDDTIHDLRVALKKDRGTAYIIKNSKTGLVIGPTVTFGELEKEDSEIRTRFLLAA